jgi:hypothetical protein
VRDRESIAHLLEAHRGSGLDRIRREPDLAEARGQRHGETGGVCGGDELLGIGARAILEARLETIGRIVQHAGFRGDATRSFLEAALPDSGPFLDHRGLPGARAINE